MLSNAVRDSPGSMRTTHAGIGELFTTVTEGGRVTADVHENSGKHQNRSLMESYVDNFISVWNFGTTNACKKHFRLFCALLTVWRY